MCNRPVARVRVFYAVSKFPVNTQIHTLQHLLKATNLLLKRIPHTKRGTNVDSVIELLSEHVARYIHAYSGAGLVVTLHAGAVAAGRGKGRLSGWACGGRDVEAVAACCCCTDAGGAGEVPLPWVGGGRDGCC
jgi:hypothetical protein